MAIKYWKLSQNTNDYSDGINLSIPAASAATLVNGLPFGAYNFDATLRQHLVTASVMPMDNRFINFRCISTSTTGAANQSLFGRTSNISGHIWIERPATSENLLFNLHSGVGTTTRSFTSTGYFTGQDNKFIITHIIADIDPTGTGSGATVSTYLNGDLFSTSTITTSVKRPAYSTVQYVGSWAATQYFWHGTISNMLIDHNDVSNWTPTWIKNDYMNLKGLL